MANTDEKVKKMQRKSFFAVFFSFAFLLIVASLATAERNDRQRNNQPAAKSESRNSDRRDNSRLANPPAPRETRSAPTPAPRENYRPGRVDRPTQPAPRENNSRNNNRNDRQPGADNRGNNNSYSQPHTGYRLPERNNDGVRSSIERVSGEKKITSHYFSDRVAPTKSNDDHNLPRPTARVGSDHHVPRPVHYDTVKHSTRHDIHRQVYGGHNVFVGHSGRQFPLYRGEYFARYHHYWNEPYYCGYVTDLAALAFIWTADAIILNGVEYTPVEIAERHQTYFAAYDDCTAAFKARYFDIYVNDFAVEPATRPMWIPIKTVIDDVEYPIIFDGTSFGFNYNGNWIVYNLWADPVNADNMMKSKFYLWPDAY